MNSADFARMSDPDRNPQFRRGWTWPPGKRIGPVAGADSEVRNGRGNGDTVQHRSRSFNYRTHKLAARLIAESLWRCGGQVRR